MALLVFYAFIAIFFSFLCSIFEAVLLSITPTFINVKKQEGKSYALTLEELKKDIDKPLIAILTLNTIAHTVGAILVGVQSENAFGTGNHMVGIVSAIMTFLILVVSEIIPKTIGATYWKQLANFTSKALLVLIFPLKWTGIIWSAQLVTRLIGKNAHKSVLSRTDFAAMAELGAEKGVLHESEYRIIKSLLNFKAITAGDIMTPRTVLSIASQDLDVSEFHEHFKDVKFSRIPVFLEKQDNITGYILKDDVLKHLADNKGPMSLEHFKRKIITVNTKLELPILFENLIDAREHIALVVDEYGALNGVVTMEDIIETLLGLEILDENDTNADMQELARKKWQERAKKIGLIDN